MVLLVMLMILSRASKDGCPSSHFILIFCIWLIRVHAQVLIIVARLRRISIVNKPLLLEEIRLSRILLVDTFRLRIDLRVQFLHQLEYLFNVFNFEISCLLELC